MCGIYKITNTVTGKMYVGKTKGNFKRRWGQHKYALRRGNSTCTYLQHTWNKHGEENFTFEVIAEGDFDKCELSKLEVIFIKLYGHYNIVETQQLNEFTQTHKEKLSKASKTMWSKKSHRDKMKLIMTKDEYWSKLNEVRNFWIDFSNGQDKMSHPGHQIITNTFGIPRSISKRMINQLQKENLTPLNNIKPDIYLYWSNNTNKYKHFNSNPSAKTLAKEFGITIGKASNLIEEFKSGEQ